MAEEPDSAFHHLFRIIERVAANVNERREKFGLGNISEYVLFWKINWDPAGYKKKLRKILGRRQFRSYDCLRE